MALAIATAIIFGEDLTLLMVIICGVLLFYGVRLEMRQDEVYGNNPEYREYIKKAPLIIMFLPIYSVAKYSWLKASYLK